MGHQLAVSRGTSVRVKDVTLNTSHILGRHTVDILPYRFVIVILYYHLYYCAVINNNAH
jgi:hypothetical protein